MKKRLLKDLPFRDLKKGTVLTRANGTYHIELGQTFYEGGGESDRGWIILDKDESELIDMIWDNQEWFVDAKLKYITLQTSEEGIFIKFDGTLDMEQAQTLAIGIRYTLQKHFGCDGNYSWNEFKGFEIKLK